MEIAPGDDHGRQSVAESGEAQATEQSPEPQIDADDRESLAVVSQEHIRDPRQAMAGEIDHLRVQDVADQQHLLTLKRDVSGIRPVGDLVLLEVAHVGSESNAQVVT